MAGTHEWEKAPAYDAATKQITAKAKPKDPAKELTYRLDAKAADGTWTQGRTAKNGMFLIEQPGAYRVVAVEEGQEATESAEVVVAASGGAGSNAGPGTATVTQEFDGKYASRAAWGLGLVFALLGLVLMVIVMKTLPDEDGKLFESSVGMAGTIAILLVFVGMVIAGAGAYLMAIEQRSVMRVTGGPATRGVADWEKVVDAFGKLKPAWAVLAAAAACFLAAAWIGGKIADSKVTPTTTTTTSSTTTTTSSPPTTPPDTSATTPTSS